MPRHRLGSTDFEVTRADIIQTLQRETYDVVVVTSLLETPAMQVLDWIRNDPWVREHRADLAYIVLTNQNLKGSKQITVLPEEAEPERIESILSRFVPREEAITGEHPRVYMRELVVLTEKSVRAQTLTAQEIVGLRKEIVDLRSDLKDELKGVKTQMDEFRIYADKQRDQIIAKFGDGPWSKIFEGLKWITDHPFIALGIFLALLTLMGCLIIGFNTLKPEKIDLIKSLANPKN